MASWFTKTLNKIGSKVTGNDNYNVWHDINKAGAGVSSGVVSAVATALPAVLQGAATGGKAGAIAGLVQSAPTAIVAGVSSGIEGANSYVGESDTPASIGGGGTYLPPSVGPLVAGEKTVKTPEIAGVTIRTDSGKVEVETLKSPTGWLKTYIPITTAWAKTAPALRGN